MTKIDGAKASERSLVAFDMLAGLAILASPLLFSPIDPVPAETSVKALVGLGVIVAMLIGLAVFSRFQRGDMDEFVRRTWESACGVGFGAVLAAHLLWSAAAQALLIRPMSSDDVCAVLIIATGIAWFWYRRAGAAA
jgi:hypothetical protein